MKPAAYLLTESGGFFPQRLAPWESMDTGSLTGILSEYFEIVPLTYADVASGKVVPRNSVIIHSSSQQPEYKIYIDDMLLYLMANGNRLVPSIHATRSHENKGYQELHRRLRQVPSLAARYVAKLEEIDLDRLELPIVFKEVSGYGSSGIRLIRTARELARAGTASIGKTYRDRYHELRTWVEKHVLGKQIPRVWESYRKPLKRFVLQEFVPGLANDYKVLVFGERVFLLKREVRPNDFRASGSGRLRFVDPPAGLLDFAYELFLKFDEPYVSMDICFDGSRFHLIEFQVVHFGPYTLTHSTRHFRRVAGEWQVHEGKVGLESIVGEALIAYLRPPAQ